MALIDSYRSTLKRKNEEKQRYLKAIASENKKIADAKKKIRNAQAAILRTKNQATIKSKNREIERQNNVVIKSEESISKLNKKISDIENEISKLEAKISKEEAKIEKEKQKNGITHQRETVKQISQLNSAVKSQELKQQELRNQIEILQKVPESITVLFLASNPIDTESLRLDAEAREIYEMIRKSEYRDTIKFETRWAVRTSDILQAINEVNPDIIHFSGHGAENGELVFEDINGQCKLVSKEAMAQTIATVSDKVKLVLFNACFSSSQAQHVVKYIDAAIGMNTSIGDEAALIFASQFYSSLGFGKSLKTSFDQARAHLMLEGTYEETTPELFLKEGLHAEEIVYIQA